MTSQPPRGPGRPRGEVARALVSAASHGPGTVAELAGRACVGRAAARYTASRLVSSGALVPLSAGRPVLLALQDWQPDALGAALERLRSAWEGAGP